MVEELVRNIHILREDSIDHTSLASMVSTLFFQIGRESPEGTWPGEFGEKPLASWGFLLSGSQGVMSPAPSL